MSNELNKAIANQFATMEKIDRIVRESKGLGGLVPEHRGYVLSLIGKYIGIALAESGICENNDNGWVVKKARDSIQSILNETLFAELNKALGLPEDYYP